VTNIPEPKPENTPENGTVTNNGLIERQIDGKPRPSTGISGDDLHTLVLAQLDDDQAVEPVSIPLAGKSSIADYMVIASGRSTRQVAAIAQKLAERLKAECGIYCKLEGLPTADWVLIDAGDVIVHIFRPEVRSFYNLERMWSVGDAPAPPAEYQP
jgi:ribosome-associated protein